MTVERTDVVIVGGGIVGAAAALFLRRQGLDVLVVEKGRLGSEASGRSGGGVRQQHRDPREIPLALEAVRLWQTLEDLLDSDLEYCRGGNYRLIHTRGQMAQAETRVQREAAQGLAVDILDADQTRRRIPILNPHMDMVGSTWCATDGTANPLFTMAAFERALRAAGVRIIEGTAVHALAPRWHGPPTVVTERVDIRAEAVIVAAGPWTGGLLHAAGVPAPIVRRNSKILISEVLPPVTRSFIGTDGGYLRQAAAGNLHLGIRGIPAGSFDKRIPLNTFFEAGRWFPHAFPILGHARVIRGFTGITAYTPDGTAIIDRPAGHRGLYVAAGFCGHGFCLGPVVGKLLAEWIVSDTKPALLAPFTLDRFG